MASPAHIILLKYGDSILLPTTEAIQEKGHKIQIIREQAQLSPAIAKTQHPIIIVDCGNNEDDAFNRVKLLIKERSIYEHPIIVVGMSVDAYESVLRRYYKVAVTLSIPASLGDILKAIDLCKKGLPARTSGAYTAPTTATNQTTEPEQQKNPPPQDIPEVVFSYVEKLGLYDLTIGGKEYTHRFDMQELLNRWVCPIEESTKENVTSLALAAGKWGTGHIVRTTYITSRILIALALNETLRSHGELAALYLGCGFAHESRSLFRNDYLGQRQLLIRKDLCSKIKDSAMKVATEYMLPQVASLLSLTAKMVGKEECSIDTGETLVANTIAAADLVDRICFQGGFWDPRAAHNFMRKLKELKIKDIHPAVIACLLRFLAEAIAASPTALTPKEFGRKNYRALPEQPPLETYEKEVPLPQLAPGMRLSRALHTADGAQVLAPDLMLDNDLIWRIWQLSALRPVAGPAVIFSIIAES
jgi:hypothetical protein